MSPDVTTLSGANSEQADKINRIGISKKMKKSHIAILSGVILKSSNQNVRIV